MLVWNVTYWRLNAFYFSIILQYFGHVFVAVNGDYTESETFMFRKLAVLNRIIGFAFGPAVKELVCFSRIIFRPYCTVYIWQMLCWFCSFFFRYLLYLKSQMARDIFTYNFNLFVSCYLPVMPLVFSIVALKLPVFSFLEFKYLVLLIMYYGVRALVSFTLVLFSVYILCCLLVFMFACL